jgi:hypothetical protein
MANYLKSPSKSSLLSMLKNADAITPKFMRSLLDGVAFKSDLVASEASVSTQSTSDRFGGSPYVKRDGSTELTADWDAGAREIRAETFESDIATGTAPLTVASTTLVDNLNADTVDGVEESAFVLAAGTRALTGDWDVGAFDIRAADLTADDGGVYTDTISELTGATGVTIDGVLLKDSEAFLPNAKYLKSRNNADNAYYPIIGLDASDDVIIGSAVATPVVINAPEGIEVDDINEKTADNGVTIDGVVIKDNGLTATADCTVGGTGDLYVDSSTSPSLYLREDADSSNYFRVYNVSDTSSNIEHVSTAGAFIRIDPKATNGSASWLQLFRDTNTNAEVAVKIYQGDGSATIQHEIDAKSGDADLAQQQGQVTIGGTAGPQKLTVVGDASFGDKGATNYVKVDSNKLLSFQGTADIAASANVPVCLDTYIDVKQRLAEYNVHGGIDSIDTAHDLSAGNLVTTVGTGKVMLVINAGGDLVGDIVVTGTTVDRDTGAETGADTDTLTIDSATTDNSDTDASGNTRHSFTGAYITSKWFKGSITISSADTAVTDMDTYQVSFEQWNDSPSYTLNTLDMNAKATNASAWMYVYLYTLEVTGDKCDITRLSTLDLPAAEVSANKYYRLRRGALATTLNGSTDGIWVDVFPGPLASTYWEDINLKVWATIKADVYGETA